MGESVIDKYIVFCLHPLGVMNNRTI